MKYTLKHTLHILLFILILVMACGGGGGGGPTSSLPACPSGPLLTTSPLGLTEFTGLTPLGNLNPPGHTFPSDHPGFDLRTSGIGSRPGDPPLEARVRAPGDIHITSVRSAIQLDSSGNELYEDYAVDFAPCREVPMVLGHIGQLSPLLRAQIGSWDSCSDNPNGGFRYCTKNLDLAVAAGEILGTAGGREGQWGIDFWAKDMRSTPLNYANPRRYYEDWLHVVCPIDYFEPALRDALMALFGGWRGLRTAEPRCGEVMQDVAGTAQGNWFVDGPGATHDLNDPSTLNWSKQLALVHDNVDPAIAVISVGGTVMPAGTQSFTPAHSGTVNREFSEVTNDGSIYCYSLPSGRFLIQLMSPTAMRAEKQSGACSGGYAFVSPTDYAR